ncbi:hypothetical protein QYF36_012808 [Acer negundo]|nr:hypothetical protein QYF36_012808 [Acer negundo]
MKIKRSQKIPEVELTQRLDCENKPKNARKELDSEKNQGLKSLLDVLRMLVEKHGYKYDRSLENKSILDVAKSRDMTFP